MTNEQYKRLEERLDRIETKVDVTSYLVAIRIVSSIGDQWRGCLTKGRHLIRKLLEERGIKL